MNRDDKNFEQDHNFREACEGRSIAAGALHRREPMDEMSDLHAIARDEGWYVPPPEVTRVALRPWQQAVFWGLRAYIVVMLAVMAVGFAKVAGQ